MHDSVVGRLYDVAVDPLRLADLLDDWERLNRPLRRALDRAMTQDQGAVPPRPAEARRAASLDFTDHFQRVTRLLEQTRAAHALRPEETELRRFARTAAFAVGPDMRLAAANEAARHGLGVNRGDRLAVLPFEARHLEALRGRIRRMLGHAADPAPESARRPSARPGREATLRLRLAESGQLILAQLALNRPGAGEAPFVLVVTSQLRWPEALTETLRDAFRLTRAEAQILRSLSEARPLREIAEERGRSIETVRAQIKAILAKTETRSQGELLRLALSVSELIPALLTPAPAPVDTLAPPPAPGVRRAGPFASPVAGSALDDALAPDHRRGDRAANAPACGPRPRPASPSGKGTARGARAAGGLVRFSHCGGLLPMRPFRSLARPDGRRLEYLRLGNPSGRVILWTHGTYGQCRWPAALEARAEAENLCILVPIRAGFGGSDPVGPGEDHASLAAEDMAALLQRLGAGPVPVLAYGDDLQAASLLARRHPDRVSALIGVSASLPLHRAEDYDCMGRWHRFLLGGARYTPDLVPFMLDTFSAMAGRMGPVDFLKTLFAQSPADSASIACPEARAALVSGAEIALDGGGHFLPVLTEETTAQGRSDWRGTLEGLRHSLPVHLLQGDQSLRHPASLRAAGRAAFPWIRHHEIRGAGELLHLQAGPDLLALAQQHLVE